MEYEIIRGFVSPEVCESVLDNVRRIAKRARPTFGDPRRHTLESPDKYDALGVYAAHTRCGVREGEMPGVLWQALPLVCTKRHGGVPDARRRAVFACRP